MMLLLILPYIKAKAHQYENLRWEFIKERFKEKKKENTLSTKKKCKIQEKRKKTRFRPRKNVKFKKKRKKNTLLTKKKCKIQEKRKKHAFDQEKK